MKLNILSESDAEIRRLERQLATGSEPEDEVRAQLLQHGLRGGEVGAELYPDIASRGDPLGSAPERVRELSEQNREWDILYQAETNSPRGTSELIQEFGRYLGTLEDATTYAEQEMERRFERYGIDAGISTGVFTDTWEPNNSYGEVEVYSRGFGHNEDIMYAVAYVAEPGWGNPGEPD